jgi:cytochrome c-type biogenesis protein CcmH/NrfF
VFSRLFSVRRLWATGVVCVLAVVMLGANGSSDPSARFGRIGHNMMCVCGCAQVLLECNHVGCPDSSRMIGELQDQLAGPNGTGADALVLNWFVGKYGATVLAAPIRGGFDNVAWAIPISLFVFATIGTGFLVKLWAGRKGGGGPGNFGGPTPAGSAAALTVDQTLRDRIRRETQY